LGTVGAANSTTRPFTSVYQAVGAGNRTSLAGALQYEDLVEAIGEMEVSRKGGLVVIAHPAFRMALRNLKDAAGDRVVATDGVLGAGVPSVFGHEVRFSFGAVTNTTFSDSTAAVGGGGAAGAVGNPLLVVAAKNELILGVRSGPESALSEHEQWTTDEIELKMRARRGFVLASADSARVIEQTNA
jgi:HK97 family phage major capsid protein